MEAYYNRGLAHASGEEVKEAEQDFSRALELRPTWGAPYAARAQLREYADEEQRKSMQELLLRLGEDL